MSMEQQEKFTGVMFSLRVSDTSIYAHRAPPYDAYTHTYTSTVVVDIVSYVIDQEKEKKGC